MIISELNGASSQTVIHPTKNKGTDMRTMRAEKFSGLVAAIQAQSGRVSR